SDRRICPPPVQLRTEDLLAELDKPSSPNRTARMYFAWALFGWIRAANVTFGLIPDFLIGRAPRIEIDYRGHFFGAIVFQVLLTITNSASLYLCSGCGMPYARPRGPGFKKPNPGEANFCAGCGRREASRQADLRRRQRVAEAIRLCSL